MPFPTRRRLLLALAAAGLAPAALTARGAAPRAKRIPTSLRRCATVYAITP